jgi:hypothetical protein
MKNLRENGRIKRKYNNNSQKIIMTDRLYAKYMWLISTIYDAGKISFEEITRKWDLPSDGNCKYSLQVDSRHRSA